VLTFEPGCVFDRIWGSDLGNAVSDFSRIPLLKGAFDTMYGDASGFKLQR